MPLPEGSLLAGGGDRALIPRARVSGRVWAPRPDRLELGDTGRPAVFVQETPETSPLPYLLQKSICGSPFVFEAASAGLRACSCPPKVSLAFPARTLPGSCPQADFPHTEAG